MSFMRFLIILFVFCPASVSAQVISNARITAMGDTGGSLANIAAYDASAVTFGYTKDLSSSHSTSFNAMTVVASNVGNFGLLAQRHALGKDFTEVGFGILYSKSIGSRVLTAVSFGYRHLSFIENHTNSNATFDVAARYYLNPEWLVGIQANPAGFVFDMSYVFDKQVLLALESEYDRQYGFDLRTGLEYALTHWLWLRGGLSVNHFKQFTGVGFIRNKMGLDLSLEYHPKLGYSSHISLNYAF